jgi:transcriptional regulator with XRE-family HTH domain
MEMVGQRLKMIRKHLGITQAKAAAETGISVATLRKYESGKSFPRIDFIEKLIQRYHVKPGWLFTGEGDMLKEPEKNDAFVHLDNKIEKLLEVADRFGEKFIYHQAGTYHRRITRKPKHIKFRYFEELLKQRNSLILKIKDISRITEVIKHIDIFENIMIPFSKAIKKLSYDLEKDGIIINELDYDLDMETLYQLDIIGKDEYSQWKRSHKS